MKKQNSIITIIMIILISLNIVFVSDNLLTFELYIKFKKNLLSFFPNIDNFNILLKLIVTIIFAIIYFVSKKQKVLSNILLISYSSFVVTEYISAIIYENPWAYWLGLIGLIVYVLITLILSNYLNTEEIMEAIINTKSVYSYNLKYIKLNKLNKLESINNSLSSNYALFIYNKNDKATSLVYINKEHLIIDTQNGLCRYDLIPNLTKYVSIGNINKSKYIIYFGFVERKIFYVNSLLTEEKTNKKGIF